LSHDWSKEVETAPTCLRFGAYKCDALFIDVDGDGIDEILFLNANVVGQAEYWDGTVMKADALGVWHAVGDIAGNFCKGARNALLSGRFQMTTPTSQFRQIEVGGQRIQIAPEPAKPKCQ
jgi:hypothetical protein